MAGRNKLQWIKDNSKNRYLKLRIVFYITGVGTFFGKIKKLEAMKKKTDIGIFYSIKKKIQHLSKADNRRDRT